MTVLGCPAGSDRNDSLVSRKLHGILFHLLMERKQPTYISIDL